MSTATPGSSGDQARAFRERARLEAERYGSDPWIFVRELLQNARDAGAERVRFTVREEEGEEVVVCEDDGEGMTFEEARRYLFALYASSKENKKNQVGKFGVGFWSVLRFEPAAIVIRSRPRAGAAWGVALDGDLEQPLPVEPSARPGTEITLRRPRGDGRLEHRIYDAVWQTGRYLSRRDLPDRPLDIEVNGRKVNAEFTLPAPSATFRRRKVRGVVGLGPAARVELFSRGLRVRSAARLEDLLAPSGHHSSWMRVRFPELPGGLAPVALLESAELEVMLSRADVRDTRALTRLVRLAQRELGRLIERQLAAARPLSWWSRLRAWGEDRLRLRLLLGAAAVVALGVLASLLVAVGLGRMSTSSWWPPPSKPPAVVSRPPVYSPPFEDLGERYRGPTVDGPQPPGVLPVVLRYWPPDRAYHFAALTFTRLAADGSPIPEPAALAASAYLAAACQREDCLQVELALRASGPAARIPVPTGHRVVAASATMAGQAPRLHATVDGHPVLVLESPAQGMLRYQTVAAADPSPPPLARAPAEMPASLRRQARRLRALPVPRRVAALLELVKRRVVYDDSAATAALHRASLARGEGFIQRTLSIAAGDCDVQNGLLTGLLQAAGVPARLAVGYLGEQGRVRPRLHGWAEYLHQGRWFVADVTVPAPSHPAGRSPVAVAAGGGSLGESTGRPWRRGSASIPEAATAEVRRPERPAVATVEPPSGEEAANLPAPARPGEVAPSSDGSAPIPAEPGSGRWPLRSSPLVVLVLLFVFVLLIVCVVVVGWSVVAARTRRAFKLDASPDLSRLLKGVLQQPGAFGHIRPLFHRPLIPLANGTAISLVKARELAHRGRLFRTGDRSSLAIAALRAGAAVVDGRTSEGKVVADALAAVDLDEWTAMIQAARPEPLLDEVNRILRGHGEEWGIKASPRVRAPLAALDLAALGGSIPDTFGTRLVMVSVEEPWLVEARRRHQARPRAATFMVLDQLAPRLGLAHHRRVQLLAECAREALMESFGGPDDQPSI